MRDSDRFLGPGISRSLPFQVQEGLDQFERSVYIQLPRRVFSVHQRLVEQPIVLLGKLVLDRHCERDRIGGRIRRYTPERGHCVRFRRKNTYNGALVLRDMTEVFEPDRERVIRPIAHPGEDHGLCTGRHDAPAFQTVLGETLPGLCQQIACRGIQIWGHRGSHVNRAHLPANFVVNIAALSAECRDAASGGATDFNDLALLIDRYYAPPTARENEGAVLFQRAIDRQRAERLTRGDDSVFLLRSECCIERVMIDDALAGFVEQERAVWLLSYDLPGAEAAEYLHEYRLIDPENP